MIGDMNKFVKLKNHDVGIIEVGNNATYYIIRIRSNALERKTNTNDVYFFDGLIHNLLSVGKLVDKGY